MRFDGSYIGSAETMVVVNLGPTTPFTLNSNPGLHERVHTNSIAARWLVTSSSRCLGHRLGADFTVAPVVVVVVVVVVSVGVAVAVSLAQ